MNDESTFRTRAFVRAIYGKARSFYIPGRHFRWVVVAYDLQDQPILIGEGRTVRDAWREASKRPNTWAAVYLPALSLGEEDPSRYDFSTEEEAYAYIFGGMCQRCQDERAAHLAGETDWQIASGYPACACEWIAVRMIDMDRATSFKEILESAGYKSLYPV